jgi:hypothetical protein
MVEFLVLLKGSCPVVGIGGALVAMHMITQKYHGWILAFIDAYDPERIYFQRSGSSIGPAINMFVLHDPTHALSEEVHTGWRILIRSFWIELFKYIFGILLATFLLLRTLIFLIGLYRY